MYPGTCHSFSQLHHISCILTYTQVFLYFNNFSTDKTAVPKLVVQTQAHPNVFHDNNFHPVSVTLNS